ncbi:MAG: valine--tRNA ligase, partial [Candidatus Altarchaeaceae archaeon]
MLPEKYNFLEIERKWQKEWIEGKYKEIYKFDENDNNKISYVIDTPPPFTSGKLHMGHVLNFIWIDIIARYKRMKNFNVLCPQGWDTQGLPTELKVEQRYKIKKDEREKFRNLCIEWTKEFIANMKSQMTMIGYIPDWSREYKTMDPEYWKLVQKSLIDFYKKGMIYRKEHPVHFCPSCGTAIAKAEIEYVKRKTLLNYIKFFISENEYIVIATTRPELIQACVAVAVNPKDEKNKNLIDKEVKVPLTERKVKIISDENVDPTFGTGIVMICTFGDEQDVKWVYKHNLQIIKAIDENGRLTKECGIYEGMKVEEARKKILQDLKEKNFIVKQEEIEQNVGIHERCKKPVEFILTNQFFIKVIEFRDKILNESKNIEWIPDYMKIRHDDWIKNMDWDWVISRQRVFGTPLPFWICENCNEIIPADENELPIDPTTKEKFCPKCKQKAIPVKDVCDCWVDSSITPLIISKWNNDEKFFNKTYPSSLRPQGHEIIRTWAFYTIFRCLMLTGKIPFNKILVNGMVLGPDGRKMSKSFGNVVEPNEIVEKYGGDAIRQWACTFVPGTDTALLMKDIEHGKRFITKFYNAARFILMNCQDIELNVELN